MSSVESAYGRKQQGLLQSLLHRQQRERVAQIHADNDRLRDLAREKEGRRKLLEKTWIQQPSHSAICGRIKTPISLQKDSKTPRILRAIDAKAAYYEDQLLTKLSFLRQKHTSTGPRRSLLVSSQASYWDSYRLRRQLKESSKAFSLENSLEKGLGRGNKAAESSPEVRLRAGEKKEKVRKKAVILPNSLYHY